MILLQLFGPMVPWRSTNIKGIRRQEKDEKEHKMVSRLKSLLTFLFEQMVSF